MGRQRSLRLERGGRTAQVAPYRPYEKWPCAFTATGAASATKRIMACTFLSILVRVCEVVLGKKANVCLSSAVLEIRNATSLELTLSTDDAYGPAMRISR